MLVRLGEMALDQAGDAARARDEFDRAWKIQEEIALHPRSGNYSEADNCRILSGIAIKQGMAELCPRPRGSRARTVPKGPRAAARLDQARTQERRQR